MLNKFGEGQDDKRRIDFPARFTVRSERHGCREDRNDHAGELL